MKKYFAVAKILFKAQIVYRFDVVLTAVATVWRVLFAWVLWGAVFGEREYVGGFSFHAMLSYYVVSSFLASIDMSEGVCGEISERIRGGSFSKYMVIPSNPQIHFAAQSFGASSFYALFSVMAAAFCAVVFRIRLSLTSDLLAILCSVIMIIIGLIFMVCYQFFIGILTFKFQDIGFFTHIQGALIAFLTGTIIPLSLLPGTVMLALRFLPFTYVTYTPAMLITGQMNVTDGMTGLSVLSVWTVIILVVGRLYYDRLRIKFDGVGI